jgi:cytochrome c biogenesis protein CcdA
MKFKLRSVCQIPSAVNLSPTLPVITGAAFVDSINPCAIAVLLILLATLVSAGDKKKAVKTAVAFIAALYLTYFALGVGLIGVLNLSGFAAIFHQFIGILAIVIGVFNIKDFFWYGGGGFAMEIPRKWRPKLKEMLGKATTPAAAFIIGIVVTLFELPCTGGPYLFVLGLLSRDLSWFKIVPILLYYNLVFVLPLIVLSGLIYFGYSSIEGTQEWKEKNIKLLHLVAGIIMVVLGVWVYWS